MGVCLVIYIVCWYLFLNDYCVLVFIDNIEDICVCMELRDIGLLVVYIVYFLNYIEKD